ncbi:hypothetical protein [Prescottella equi]|uniref:hypothetical protein n=1 Tax=Rhodococcus hoagii TaxID=43767 RepID=UPI001C859B21|nr:hypothetical protein [Prescottella equi]
MTSTADILTHQIRRAARPTTTFAEEGGDLRRLVDRLNSTQARHAQYTPGAEPRHEPEETALDKFIRIMSPKTPEPEPEPAPLPLNGAALLRAALGGQQGSVNGAATDSAAGLIRGALAARQDFAR